MLILDPHDMPFFVLWKSLFWVLTVYLNWIVNLGEFLANLDEICTLILN